MWKLIFFGLIIWLVYHFVKRIFRQNDINKTHHQTTANHASSDSENQESELMVKCDKCAVHIPRSEAFMIAGQFYCSKAHLPKK